MVYCTIVLDDHHDVHFSFYIPYEKLFNDLNQGE